jgi:hypothetical protein
MAPNRLSVVLLATAFFGCESGSSGPTISSGPATMSSGGTSAAVPMSPPRRDEKRVRELKRVVLVEASGGRSESGGRRGEPEVDAFVSRFLSDVSDKDSFVVSDARLSGASVASLMADPNGAATTAFRQAWPGDAYLAAIVGECSVKTSSFTMRDRTPEGYQYDKVFISFDATCPASLKLVDAGDGRMLANVEVTGRAKYQGDDAETGRTPAEEEAAQDAATRAVKKLRNALGR